MLSDRDFTRRMVRTVLTATVVAIQEFATIGSLPGPDAERTR